MLLTSTLQVSWFAWLLRDVVSVMPWACQVDIRSFNILNAMNVRVAVRGLHQPMHSSRLAEACKVLLEVAVFP